MATIEYVIVSMLVSLLNLAIKLKGIHMEPTGRPTLMHIITSCAISVKRYGLNVQSIL